MTYQRITRRQRHSLLAKQKLERVHTAYGLLFNALRFFGAARLARLLMRRPWHVADLYRGGQFVRGLYMYPKETDMQRVQRLEDELRHHMARQASSSTPPRR
jgi:hypothetical protein